MLGVRGISTLKPGDFAGFSNLSNLGLNDNSGAPFTFTAELEQRGEDVVVKVAEGAPFDMAVTLSVEGGTLSTTTVVIAGGDLESAVETEHGERACLQVVVERGEGKRPLVARFGGIPLKRNRQAVLADQKPQRYRTERNELIKRLLADECEMCGSTVGIEVHHVRALRDLNVKGQREKPKWGTSHGSAAA